MANQSVFYRKSHMFPIQNLQGYRYVVLQADKQVFFAQAPITGVQIQEQVDYNIVKTLNGNFGMLTFQDHPVVLTLSGIRNMASNLCKGLFDRGVKNGVADLYAQYKSSLKKQDIAIKITIGDITYKGVIVSLTQGSAGGQFPGILSYDLKLYGARM